LNEKSGREHNTFELNQTFDCMANIFDFLRSAVIHKKNEDIRKHFNKIEIKKTKNCYRFEMSVHVSD
jgi:hypothetical protein